MTNLIINRTLQNLHLDRIKFECQEPAINYELDGKLLIQEIETGGVLLFKVWDYYFMWLHFLPGFRHSPE